MKYSLYDIPHIPDMRKLVKRAAAEFGDKNGFADITPDGLSWHSFARLADDMDALGTALCARGVSGANIALVSENSYAWVLSFLTVINGVGTTVPIDIELHSEDVASLLGKAEISAVFSSAKCLKRVKDAVLLCGRQIDVFCMTPSEGLCDIGTLIAEGRALLQNGDTSYTEAPIDMESCAEILFTSGTTGANKGVMLCQRNMMAVFHGSIAQIRITKNDTSFSVLPLHHSFECHCHLFIVLYYGCSLIYNDNLRNIGRNLLRFKPSASAMVPLMLETVYNTVQREIKRQNKYEAFKKACLLSAALRRVGIDKRRSFFKDILEKLGGNLKFVVCGGAPLRDDVQSFFDDIGIEIVNGYGITECAPLVAVNSTSWQVPCTVGRPILGTEVEIREKDALGIGEIFVRGTQVMLGYYNDAEATSKVMSEDGYLITGDRGFIDKKGMLHITGRSKNLIVLSNGKNVSPEELEEKFQSEFDYIKEIIVDMDTKLQMHTRVAVS